MAPAKLPPQVKTAALSITLSLVVTALSIALVMLFECKISG